MQKHVNLVDLVKSFPTNIYYLTAKYGFDTAENEHLKVLYFRKPKYYIKVFVYFCILAVFSGIILNFSEIFTQAAPGRAAGDAGKRF